ncbi:MAG: apolipoprotein N-acyltransferase [Simkaniaceae bacterium]|nr:apolipoprotein N-acyltransferase [Simkaniaceae bacterium]
MIFYFLSLSFFFIKPLAPLAAIGGYALFWKGLQNEKRPFLAALLWFSAIHAVDLSWLLSFDYHGIYIIAVYVLLILLFALPFALVPFRSKEIWILTSYFVMVEYAIQHFLLCGFTMQQIGLLLTRNLYSAQLASISGVLGLTGYVIWTNLFMLRARHFGVLLGVAFFPYLFGWGHIAWHSKEIDKAPRIKVALVQTGLRSEEKRPLGSLETFISPYEQWRRIITYLSKEKKYDLIVLPEVAVPFDAERGIYEKEIVEQIFFKITGKCPVFKHRFLSNLDIAKGLASHFQAEVVIGLIDGKTNSAFFIKEEVVEKYVKQILLPMAETLPFESLRKISMHYGVGGFLTEGKESVVFSSGLNISPSICYEEMLSHIVREGRMKGGTLFVNLSNDVWFPSTRLPVKHFITSRIRSIENGVPLLRSCNTGITTAIDSLGRSLGAFHVDKDYEWAKGVLVAQVPIYHYDTVYLFFGEQILLGLSGFCLMFYPLRKIISKHMLNNNTKIAQWYYGRSS